MSMIITDSLFFLDSTVQKGEIGEIQGDEARHALQSRRMIKGDTLFVTNGKGYCGQGIIEEIGPGKKSLSLRICDVEQISESKPEIILASALPKGDRQSVLINMATQLGMNRFIPLECDFSSVKFVPKMKERWQRQIVTACKQSRRCHFPDVLEPESVESLIETADTKNTLIITADDKGHAISGLRAVMNDGVEKLILVVGPEGGFSEREKQLFGSIGLFDESQDGQLGLQLRLSNHILRTETAAISLIAAVNQGIG